MSRTTNSIKEEILSVISILYDIDDILLRESKVEIFIQTALLITRFTDKLITSLPKLINLSNKLNLKPEIKKEFVTNELLSAMDKALEYLNSKSSFLASTSADEAIWDVLKDRLRTLIKDNVEVTSHGLKFTKPKKLFCCFC